ncbi:hypothetical protein NC653_007499 [Populus alba x Populus x berolinensis]|uniref:Uncharacterized protein n=1 Tax=Populus alba x Populus x berolinensis TaxID=444605 RepID=A0AAD6RHK1_9ROSI|nr:hypothetical protein NC653_007499 [Populus alba x Populus x berolinensis]
MERSSEVVYGKIGREETRGDFYGSAVGIFYEEGGGASAAAANAKLLPKGRRDEATSPLNEALPRQAPCEWVQGVKANACLKKMEEQKPKEQRPKANENKPVMTE